VALGVLPQLPAATRNGWTRRGFGDSARRAGAYPGAPSASAKPFAQNIAFELARARFSASQGAEFFALPTSCGVSQCSIAVITEDYSGGSSLGCFWPIERSELDRNRIRPLQWPRSAKPGNARAGFILRLLRAMFDVPTKTAR
jgi:hypothetical protein